ncbi:DUF2971 domain-containing protein [Stagnimonas aquatica]|uniref:DUF2971 domain-containing protein n=1 Tax=Stagnimonas aquatica TaxID=2689987 RepID=A0A3N0UZP1_9GAMM|nr:DUF2971 domain-containing protein [Stagnimonas aquatica]ROH85990.1 DUF2971 domain-containing protein [Stagnimonas aquatica]
MKLFNLTDSNHGLLNLALRRIKVSRVADLNDPFELLPVNVRNKDLRAALRHNRDEFNRKRGILCFSPSWSSPVMWAHYGDKHKGMALGFEIPDHLVAQVNYSATLLDFDVSAISDPTRAEDETKKLFVTKYSGWSYEDERRVFVDLAECEEEGGLHFAPFSKDIRLEEVVIGERSSASVKRVKELVSSYPHPIRVRKARCAFTKYGVTENRYRVASKR